MNICTMIDAEMYGITPIAKIEKTLERTAREHVDMPRIVLDCRRRSARPPPGRCPERE
jgi:hypothetical protein